MLVIYIWTPHPQKTLTENCMLTPKIIFVGPQKSGTTWIYECLKESPLICTPKNVKETFFFDRYFCRGMPWYESHFRSIKSGQIACEVAPTYFDNEEVTFRIEANCPECRVICTLREPASRTFSLYLHMRRKGYTSLPFKDALAVEPRLLSSGNYYSHIKRWMDVFGSDRVKVLIMDDLISDQNAYLTDIYKWIGVDPHPIPEKAKGRINAADFPRYHWLAHFGKIIADKFRYHGGHWIINLAVGIGMRNIFFGGGRQNMPSLTTDEKYWLQKYFKQEISLLEDLIKRDLSQWKP
jgi:hypothetical protein